MIGSIAELGDLAKATARRRRHRADYELKYWAQHRAATLEGLGWPSLSVMARIKIEHDGAGERSTAPGALLLVERQSERFGRVLQVERLVRDMPREWIAVIELVYLKGKSQCTVAMALGIERWRLVSRLQDAQERLVAVLELWPRARAYDQEAA